MLALETLPVSSGLFVVQQLPQTVLSDAVHPILPPKHLLTVP